VLTGKQSRRRAIFLLGVLGLAASESLAQAAERVRVDPWRDWIHWVGIVGGLAAVVTLLVGLYLYFVVARRRGADRVLVRRRARRWHIAAGLLAATLALAHALLRFHQFGNWEIKLRPPVLALFAFLLLALSGVIRAWPPRRLARHHRVWTWTHRVLLVVALTMLALHAVAATRYFLRRSAMTAVESPSSANQPTESEDNGGTD
jgi:hypothetical protein